VGLLVTLRPQDRPLAPPGEDADPKEYPWYFEGRGRRMAVISGRRLRVERYEKAHYRVTLAPARNSSSSTPNHSDRISRAAGAAVSAPKPPFSIVVTTTIGLAGSGT